MAQARDLDVEDGRSAILLGVGDTNAGDAARVTRQLRGSGVLAPILLICSGPVGHGVRAALEAGATDFVQRCSVNAELSTRLAFLASREARCPGDDCIRVADLRIDRDRRSIRRGRNTVPLTNREFRILEFLAQHAGKAVRREDLANHLGNDKSSNLVDVYIYYLRRKLSVLGYDAALRTLRGVGYAMIAPSESRVSGSSGAAAN